MGGGWGLLPCFVTVLSGERLCEKGVCVCVTWICHM